MLALSPGSSPRKEEPIDPRLLARVVSAPPPPTQRLAPSQSGGAKHERTGASPALQVFAPPPPESDWERFKDSIREYFQLTPRELSVLPYLNAELGSFPGGTQGLMTMLPLAGLLGAQVIGRMGKPTGQMLTGLGRTAASVRQAMQGHPLAGHGHAISQIIADAMGAPFRMLALPDEWRAAWIPILGSRGVVRYLNPSQSPNLQQAYEADPAVQASGGPSHKPIVGVPGPGHKGPIVGVPGPGRKGPVIGVPMPTPQHHGPIVGVPFPEGYPYPMQARTMPKPLVPGGAMPAPTDDDAMMFPPGL